VKSTHVRYFVARVPEVSCGSERLRAELANLALEKFDAWSHENPKAEILNVSLRTNCHELFRAFAELTCIYRDEVL